MLNSLSLPDTLIGAPFHDESRFSGSFVLYCCRVSNGDDFIEIRTRDRLGVLEMFSMLGKLESMY